MTRTHVAISASDTVEEADEGVEILLTVEDPTKANLFNPADVQVVAVATDSEVPVTTTAKVFKASKADAVVEKTVDKTVQEAAVVQPAEI
ncbi:MULTISPECIES: hypothetical protein [unclassified Streptomyces]|uniref:hypothetical protein n=1 Tax=unclassified Streptomyces TaxID=2593676 RepID=UPI00365B1629